MSNQQVFDLSVRYAVFLQRLTNGQLRRILELVDDLNADLEVQVRRRLKRLSKRDLTALARGRTGSERLKELRAFFKVIEKEANNALREKVRSENVEVAKRLAKRNQAIAQQAVGITANLPTVKQLREAIDFQPFDGQVLREWTAEWSAARTQRVTRQLRIGIVNGEGVPTLMQRLTGTPANNFNDGVLEVSKRGAQAIVRTAANHARSSADVEFGRANEDNIDHLLRRAVLDQRTSNVCRINDGAEYSPDEAEGVLPAHPNCRTIFVTIWKGQGRPDDDDYFEWLDKQSLEIQEEALGKTRAKLFREGGLKGKQLVNEATGEAYTLEQLAEREAQAFDRISE